MKEKIKKIICGLVIMAIVVHNLPISQSGGSAYASTSANHNAISKVRKCVNYFPIPELGDYGSCYELKLDGEPAFCLLRGAPANSNKTYNSSVYGDNLNINKALQYYENNRGANPGYQLYTLVQVYIWCELEGRNAATAMAQANSNMGNPFDAAGVLAGIQGTEVRHYYNVFYSSNASEQPLATMLGIQMEAIEEATAEASSTKEGSLQTKISLQKMDAESKNPLSGVEFAFYVDGKHIGDRTTDESGRAEITYSENKTVTRTAAVKYSSNYDELSYYYRSKYNGYTSYNDAYKKALESASSQASSALEQELSQTTHTYSAVEKNPKTGYLLPEQATVQKSLKGSGQVDFSLENEPMKGSILIKKLGRLLDGSSDEAETAQQKEEDQKEEADQQKKAGLVTLADATFAIRAKEAVLAPDGSGQIIYEAGEEIESLTTDDNGEASLDGLPLGVYELVETKAPEGYIKSDEVYECPLSVERPDVSIEVINEPVPEPVEEDEPKEEPKEEQKEEPEEVKEEKVEEAKEIKEEVLGVSFQNLEEPIIPEGDPQEEPKTGDTSAKGLKLWSQLGILSLLVIIMIMRKKKFA